MENDSQGSKQAEREKETRRGTDGRDAGSRSVRARAREEATRSEGEGEIGSTGQRGIMQQRRRGR